ncbi:hypothetical protein ACU8DI_12130 [Psychroserpens sp. BH13MA-6]
MKHHICLIILLVLCSCHDKAEAPKSLEHSEPIIAPKIERKTASKSETDVSNTAELFAKEVLQDHFRKHTYTPTDSTKPKHTDIFENVGLQNIVAYSNKNYPKHSAPTGYEHFILFVANYQSELNALKTFALITSSSKENPPAYLLAQKTFIERTKALNIGAKPGGMIVQSGRHIFSLVETCRATPIGGTWHDYEDRFITFITKNEAEIDILNADCGMNRYRLEKRNVSR